MAYQSDIDARSKGLLPWQYRQASGLALLMVGCWSPWLQSLEDDIDELKRVQWRWTTATGVWLDAWGELAQMPRPEGPFYEDDEAYRRAISGRWAARRSLGDANSLIKIGAAMLGVAAGESGIVVGEASAWTLFLDYPETPDPAERAVMGELFAAGARLGISLIVTVPVAGSEMFGQQVHLASRERAAYDRHAGTFRIIPEYFFMDRLRLGHYTADTFGIS